MNKGLGMLSPLNGGTLHQIQRQMLRTTQTSASKRGHTTMILLHQLGVSKSIFQGERLFRHGHLSIVVTFNLENWVAEIIPHLGNLVIDVTSVHISDGV